MNAPTFKTFGEAASYASRRAQELGTAVKIGRSNDEWFVFLEPEQPAAITPLPDNQTKQSLPTEYSNWSKRQRDAATKYSGWWGRLRDAATKYSSWWEGQCENKRKKDGTPQKSEDQRRKAEEKSREVEKKERQDRRSYIEERRRYYRSFSEMQLDELWNSRESQGFKPDEIALLREILREAKGINPVEIGVKVCRQCGMVGDNCTCGRSWF